MAVYLHLRNRICYNAMRRNLYFLDPNTMKNDFGTIGRPDELYECENTINSIFSKLTDKQRYYKILPDEIHIKPTIPYQGNRVIGYFCDEPLRPSRTVLAIMIAPMMGHLLLYVKQYQSVL